MAKRMSLQEAARWIEKHGQDFLVALKQLNLANSAPRSLQHATDLEALWRHCLEELVVALLRKEEPKVRKRFLTALEEHFKHLEFLSLWQRKADESLDSFLATAPTFTLPDSRGGLRKAARPSDVPIQAVKDFDALLNCLNRKLSGRYRNSVTKRRDIKSSLEEAWGTPDEVPSEKLQKWADLSEGLTARQIALEATAWKHALGVQYLKRLLPRIRTAPLLSAYADFRKALEGNPFTRNIHEKPRLLRARVQRSQD